jgi:hypothetical protein
MGGRHDAHIDRLGLRRADRPYRPLLQHAQQLHLQRRRHVADLVEKQRATVRCTEQAGVARDRATEGAAFVTEQFGFEQRVRYRAAVDGDERRLRARAGAVQRARQQFLAGAAVAAYQHAGIGGSDQPRLVEQ